MISIITPTYNRAYILSNLYRSLMNQTSSDFEWVIIDDGSTDNTKQIVNEWLAEKKVNIVYHFQANKGKPSSLNAGVRLCKSDFFMCVDSDDTILPDTIESLDESLKALTGEHYGIVAYKLMGEKVLCEFPKLDSSTLSNLYYHGFFGETSLLLRKHYVIGEPYPVINNEKFIPEDYLYDRLDRKYTLKIIRKAFIVATYLSDGLTNNIKTIVKKSQNSYREYFFNKYEYSIRTIIKFKSFINYIVFSLITKKLSSKMTLLDCVLLILLFPLGFFVFLRRKTGKRE